MYNIEPSGAVNIDDLQLSRKMAAVNAIKYPNKILILIFMLSSSQFKLVDS